MQPSCAKCFEPAYFGFYTTPLCARCKLKEDPTNFAAVNILAIVDGYARPMSAAPEPAATQSDTTDYMAAVREIVRGSK